MYGYAAMDDYYGEEYDDLSEIYSGRDFDSTALDRRWEREDDEFLSSFGMYDDYDDDFEMYFPPDPEPPYGSERHGFMRSYCSLLSNLKYAKEDRHHGGQSSSSHRDGRTKSRCIAYMKRRASRMARKVNKEITGAAIVVYMEAQ